MDKPLDVLYRRTYVYNESGTKLLYTIRPCPRSLIVSRHPTSKRPYYTPWSRVLCHICQPKFDMKMKDFQRHFVKWHSLDIRGEFKEAPDGSLRVTCRNFDATKEEFSYDNIVKYISYCSHDGRGLYVENTDLAKPSDKSCICLSCLDFYTAKKIREHTCFKKTHGFDLTGSWKDVIDECGNHVIDSRLHSDPVRTPLIFRDENFTKEGFITVYDENNQPIYSIEPRIKPTLRNCWNELLYTSTTLCTCRLCEAQGIIVKQYHLTHIHEHVLGQHEICLRNKYKREPGKIIFESTKRSTDLDNILDVNKSVIYWDQNGIPVWWRIKKPTNGNLAYFCLRCENGFISKSNLYQHLKKIHEITMYDLDQYCYLNLFGDFVYYFDNHNAIHAGTSSSSTTQGAVKRPTTDPNANFADASFSKYRISPQRTATQTTQGAVKRPAADPNANFADASFSKYRISPQRTATQTSTSNTAGLTASATTGSSQTSIGTTSYPVLKSLLMQTAVTQHAQIIAAPTETSPGTSSTQDIPTSSAMTTGQAAIHPAPQGKVDSQTATVEKPCGICNQPESQCDCIG